MARRRQMAAGQAAREGAWLRSLLADEGVSQKELAQYQDIAPANVGFWCKGASPIPDLDLLQIGKRFNRDVFALRPSLLDYAPYFEGNSILDGLSSESRRKLVDDAEYLRKLESRKVIAPSITNQVQLEKSLRPVTPPQFKKEK